MNEQQQMISESLSRLLGDLCTADVVDASEAGVWAGNLWQALVDTGLTLAGISEAAGGSGGDIEDSLLVIRQAAGACAPVPLAEHFIAAHLLAEQGASVTAEPMTIATGDFSLEGATLRGSARDVAWARFCEQVIVIADADGAAKLCRVAISDAVLTHGANMAGEPRDKLEIESSLAAGDIFDVPENTADRMRLMGAAMRGLMMSGALESVLEMSVQYAMERTQFGRPISKFQAIQQQLAILAGEVAASTMAGHAIVAAFNDLDRVDIAIGKARIGEAVSQCTDIAHQVHGAMGYTMEHTLNHRTRRLWSWRNEHGAERSWQIEVGQAFLANGADGLWDSITRQSRVTEG